jgi:CheY-like chemotaxis protein
VRRLIGTVADAAGVSESIQTRLTTCFSEAATNIAQHTLPPATAMRVQLGQNHREWWLALSDDGSRAETRAEPGTDATATHGRGLLILDALADDISETRLADGDHLTVMRFLRSDRDALPRLLVVDDDPALRLLYRRYLDGHYDVSCAANGTDALQCLERERFDAILSDIHMPDVNGFELRQALLSDTEHELVPFLFLTGANDAPTLALAQQMIIDDCLQKPMSREQLIDAVDRVLLRKRQLQQRIGGRLVRSIGNFLPGGSLADSPHWGIRHGSRSSGEGGGDLVLEHRIGDIRIIALADVMGHDAQAKFFAVSYAGFLRGLFAAMREPLAPHVIMRELSAAISHHTLLQASMLTCCILALHGGGRVEFCTAGHPPLLHITARGIEPLSSDGVLPGLVDNPNYDSSEIVLNSGERLAVFTDGLLESAPTAAQREHLEAQIMRVLQTSAERVIDDVIETALYTFDTFASPSSRDDASLVIIEPLSPTRAVS